MPPPEEDAPFLIGNSFEYFSRNFSNSIFIITFFFFLIFHSFLPTTLNQQRYRQQNTHMFPRWIPVFFSIIYRTLNIWSLKKISLDVRQKFAKSYVWSIILNYGCENWCLIVREKQKLSSTEMWIWAGMTKTSWIENEWQNSRRNAWK